MWMMCWHIDFRLGVVHCMPELKVIVYTCALRKRLANQVVVAKYNSEGMRGENRGNAERPGAKK